MRQQQWSNSTVRIVLKAYIMLKEGKQKTIFSPFVLFKQIKQMTVLNKTIITVNVVI